MIYDNADSHECNDIYDDDNDDDHNDYADDDEYSHLLARLKILQGHYRHDLAKPVELHVYMCKCLHLARSGNIWEESVRM